MTSSTREGPVNKIVSENSSQSFAIHIMVSRNGKKKIQENERDFRQQGFSQGGVIMWCYVRAISVRCRKQGISYSLDMIKDHIEPRKIIEKCIELIKQFRC